MPTIKNVSTHVDDLHDGRPIEAYGTAEIATDDLKLAHYQDRIQDGTLLVVESAPPPAASKQSDTSQEASK